MDHSVGLEYRELPLADQLDICVSVYENKISASNVEPDRKIRLQAELDDTLKRRDEAREAERFEVEAGLCLQF